MAILGSGTITTSALISGGRSGNWTHQWWRVPGLRERGQSPRKQIPNPNFKIQNRLKSLFKGSCKAKTEGFGHWNFDI